MNAREKRKGIPSLRLYDLDNRLLSESPGKKKISVNPQKLSYSGWEVPLGNLQEYTGLMSRSMPILSGALSFAWSSENLGAGVESSLL